MIYQLFSKFPGRMLIILLHTDSQNAWKQAKGAIDAVLFKAGFLNPHASQSLKTDAGAF